MFLKTLIRYTQTVFSIICNVKLNLKYTLNIFFEITIRLKIDYRNTINIDHKSGSEFKWLALVSRLCKLKYPLVAC